MARSRQLIEPAAVDTAAPAAQPASWPLGPSGVERAVVLPPMRPANVAVEPAAEAPTTVMWSPSVVESPKAAPEVPKQAQAKSAASSTVESLVIADMESAMASFKDADNRRRVSALDELELRIKIVKTDLGI